MRDLNICVIGALLCQDRFEAVKAYVNRVLPHVSDLIVVDNGSTDGSREWLRQQPGVNLIERQWNDSFADARNAYLEMAANLSSNYDATLIAAADDDEIYSDDLLKDLKKVAQWMYYDDLNVCYPFSKNAETNLRGEIISEWDGGYYKPLIFMWESGLHYEDAFGHFHEDAKPATGWRGAKLNIDASDGGKYYYTHIKQYGETWLRATRNAFAGGGGPNLGTRCPLWMPFRTLLSQVAGIQTSDQLQKYLKAGNIDPLVKQHFIRYRYLGTDRDVQRPAWAWAEWPDGTSEWREGFLAYFIYLHPEEMPEHLRAEYLDEIKRVGHDVASLYGSSPTS